MSNIEVEYDDLRTGDIVTLSFEGREVSGEVFLDDEDDLMLGGIVVRYRFDGSLETGYEFVRAERPEPELPTETGALVRATVFDKLLLLTREDGYTWRSASGLLYGDYEIEPGWVELVPKVIR